MSGLAQCCKNQKLQWTQEKVGEKFADVLTCASCGHLHGKEAWYAPLKFPGPGKCVNCSGNIVTPPPRPKFTVLIVRPGDEPPEEDPHCEKCRLTPDKCEQLHKKYAALHPEGDYLKAAEAAAELGRHVLSLKLATAAVRWGNDPIVARTARLQELDALGAVDAALDEGYEWAKHGAPAIIWSMLADLEVSAGNLEAAIKALQYGLSLMPENYGMWGDMGELLLHMEDYKGALRAARKSLADPDHLERGLDTILAIAEKFYNGGHVEHAIGAMENAEAHQERHVGMAWLHARIANEQVDEARTLEWLARVLAIEPGHAQAKKLQEQMRPPEPQKKGWFW